MFPYLVLLRTGFTLPSSVATDAVGSYPTFSPLPVTTNGPSAVQLSVALSIGSRRPDVIWRPVLWSPDFPLFTKANSDYLANLAAVYTSALTACCGLICS